MSASCLRKQLDAVRVQQRLVFQYRFLAVTENPTNTGMVVFEEICVHGGESIDKGGGIPGGARLRARHDDFQCGLIDKNPDGSSAIFMLQKHHIDIHSVAGQSRTLRRGHWVSRDSGDTPLIPDRLCKRRELDITE